MTRNTIPFPPSPGNQSGTVIELKDRVMVIIGANGSGKTRLGAWLDKANTKLHHRIAAHRSLSFPDRVQPMDTQEAELRLLIGHNHSNNGSLYDHFREHNRWGNNPAVTMLNDYEPLVTLLMSESFEVSDGFLSKAREAAEKSPPGVVNPPTRRLDRLKRVWESVLPSRELVYTGSRIEARNRSSPTNYHARDMSDGERGIFYLIGEALCVPQGGVLIVDEPELHLHRGIQSTLWDAIEHERPDCRFVYITHDLEFAASRKDATKVWLKEYADNHWDWCELPESDCLPEPLLFEVIGSRRPILFVEGTRASLDYLLYGKLFPAATIIPCGSCDAVVHATKSFAQMSSLHHNTCTGLIDNDGRAAPEIERLQKIGVSVLSVALVENLLITEPVLRWVAQMLGFEPEKAVEEIRHRILSRLKIDAVQVISNLTRQEIESNLRNFGAGPDGADAIANTFNAAAAKVDPRGIYDRWQKSIEASLVSNDYGAALRLFKSKGLSSEASTVLKCQYNDQLLRWLRGEQSCELLKAVRKGAPEIYQTDKLLQRIA